MIYQLSYELRTPDYDYTSLYNYLETHFGDNVKHVLRDTWWLASSSSLDLVAIVHEMRDKIGANDGFYVSLLDTNEINGWLPSTLWQWFNDNK